MIQPALRWMRSPMAPCAFVACLLAGCAPATHPDSASHPDAPEKVAPAHLRDAERIAHEIDSAHNEYAHTACFIRWKGQDGAAIYENRTDCSDFLNLLLAHAYQVTPDDLLRLTGHDKPTATIWYDTVLAGKGFTIIPTLPLVQPGDIIAVQYPPGGTDTGHIMIVAGAPQPRASTAPLVDNTRQWEIRIIDSSKSGHGPTDTRHHPDGTFDRGVGAGILRLYTNPDGSLAGYAWSVLAVSVFEPSTVHKIVLGRLQVQNIHTSPRAV